MIECSIMFCKWLLLVLCLCAAVCLHGCIGLSCDKMEKCRCSMSDNSGEINLKSLASNDGTAAFSVLDDVGWEYQFNPCEAFSSIYYSGLSIVQLNTGNIYDEYALGIQTTEKFSYSSSSGLSLQYADSLIPVYVLRNSSVLLICEYDSLEHRFEFIGELITLQYEFILTSPCACPGRCDDYGIVGSTVPPSITTTTHMTTTTATNPTEIPPVTLTTTPAGTTTTAAKPIEGMNWNLVGANIVALLFHDLIIIALMAIVIAIAKFLLGFSCNLPFGGSPESHKQFSNA